MKTFSGLLSLVSLASTLSHPAFANDVQANNCEIFLDKLVVTTESHALTKMKFYLKVIEAKLDSPLASVDVWHTRSENWGSSKPSSSEKYGWRMNQVQKFSGSPDYFEYIPTTGHSWMSANEQMVFSALSQNGTRYWLNAQNLTGRNFEANATAVDTLAFEYSSGRKLYRSNDALRSIFQSPGTGATDFVAKTADYPWEMRSLYNINGCK
jgi:hypothetical protein